MKIGTAFPSNYLKADDFNGDTTYTIKSVEIVTLGQDSEAEEKPVVYFREAEKGLVLNKTNADIISEIYGDETEGWVGKSVVLYSARVQFGSKMTNGIRVRDRKELASQNSHRQSTAPQSGQSGDAAAMRSESLAKAWKKFRMENAGDTPESAKEKFSAAQQKYFNGRPHQSIGAHEWQQFANDNFVKPAAPADPFANEPAAFDDASIPF